jgi:hypothetical protein
MREKSDYAICPKLKNRRKPLFSSVSKKYVQSAILCKVFFANRQFRRAAEHFHCGNKLELMAGSWEQFSDCCPAGLSYVKDRLSPAPVKITPASLASSTVRFAVPGQGQR